MIQMASFGRKGRSGQIQDNTLSVHKRIILEAFFSLFSAFFYVFSLNRLLLTGSARHGSKIQRKQLVFLFRRIFSLIHQFADLQSQIQKSIKS